MILNGPRFFVGGKVVQRKLVYDLLIQTTLIEIVGRARINDKSKFTTINIPTTQTINQ